MSFYLNDFKAHLEQLSKSVPVTDHTDPRQWKKQITVSLEESYKNMQKKKTNGLIRETRSY